MTKQGELWSAAGPQAKFSRVASGFGGCLLAVNDRSAYIAGEGPIARVDLRTGSHAIIFRDEPALALALTDRNLYFRTPDHVRGIRLDAPAL